MRIFFSVGEPSGDLHGANLIRALREANPDVECVGYGGPQMAANGCELHYDLTALAVMWILRALVNLHKFLALVGRADRYFRHQRPDAVVLVDFPGFNWWIAWRAKAHGIPVFYYTPPQIWAWASWRVKKMRRFVDHVLCSLPFEERWLRERGCQATFVGHPFFDEVRRHPYDEAFLERIANPAPLVAILPGSRTQEVEANLPTFLRAAALVRERVPQARFAVACFKPHQARIAQRMATTAGLELPIYVQKTPELMRAATCTMAVSGSVSLELLHHAKPTVILYRISRFAYWVQSKFRHSPYITLVNLLALADPFDREAVIPPAEQAPLFPEHLTFEDRSAAIADRVATWLGDETSRQALVSRLETLRNRVGDGGASRRGAVYILATLAARTRPAPRPHLLPLAASIATSESPLRDAA